jgi:hypothetical protein
METKKMRKGIFLLLLSALLVVGVLLTGCSTDDEPPVIKPDPVKPATERISVEISRNLSSTSYVLTDWQAAPETLRVEVSAKEWDEDRINYKAYPLEEGAVSYQWYSKESRFVATGTAIENATEASYLPNISEAKKYYYYVEVEVTLDETKPNKKLTSTTAEIEITTEAKGPAPTQFTIGSDRICYVRGVGGTGSFMFRWGTNADASPDADVKYIDLLMGEIGCNVLRIMVQDNYLKYLENEEQSKNQSVFYHNARDNFLAVIKRANELNGYVFANPWTGPGEFKSNGTPSGSGGSFIDNASNFVGYADWLREFLKYLNANDAPIFSLGILNEPDWGLSASYEGMGMSDTQHRDWFKTVGHFTTQRVTNKSGAGVDSSIFEDDVIPGFGGGRKTHHVVAMTADSSGNIPFYNPTINDQSPPDQCANNNFEILGIHWYGNPGRVERLVGPAGTKWEDPVGNFVLRGDTGYEAKVLAESPHMYAPGSTPGNIKREVWQTEHDHNFGSSTQINGSNPQRYWNSAFAAMHEVDWAFRVIHESVYDWWFSSSHSGFVTSYQGTPVDGNASGRPNAGAIAWGPYEFTPRGRAIAHYARYVNETWTLPIESTGTSPDSKGEQFNRTMSYDCGTVDPKISAYEDVNGKFISIVMYTPNASTNTNNINNNPSRSGSISNGFGQGGSNGTNDPRILSVNVGRIEVVLPNGFTATSASALRSYGWTNADGQVWDDVPSGTPRYWIDEPVYLKTTGGKSSVEVTLPGGNIISIMVKGTWPGRPDIASPERLRPFTVN